MEIQTPTSPNQIRTLALVPDQMEKQLVKWEPPIEARPIPRPKDSGDFEQSQPTDSEIAQWNTFVEYEIAWRLRLLNIAMSRRRTLTPHQRRELRGQLYQIERGQRCDVTLPWNETHQLLPPALSRALWHEVFAAREQKRIDSRFAAARLAVLKLDTDPSLTYRQRMALHRRCWRALDKTAPRMGGSLPESWKPKSRPTHPLGAYFQTVREALSFGTGGMLH